MALTSALGHLTKLHETKAGYYGLISHLDDQLALFLAKLQQKVKNVYTIFISDHGEMLGDHYFYRKSLPYEGSAHIPFLLSGPGIEAGTVVDAPVGLQDVLPTCCDIVGLGVPTHVTGRSVFGLARGQADPEFRIWLHGEHAPMPEVFPGMHLLTDAKTKYIWFLDGREQFFDLEDDPSETTDLSTSEAHREQLQRWRGHLVKRLTGRPEGFTDGSSLIPNVPYKNSNSVATRDPERL